MLNIKTLPKLPAGGRLIIVGDIHGCIDEFDALIASSNYQRRRDVLLLVGDLVNKGYDSVGVVRRAMQVGALSIMGNHDAAVLAARMRVLDGDIVPSSPEYAEDPVVQLAATLPYDCFQYLDTMPHMYRIPEFNVLVVHAGINPKIKNFDDQNLWEVLHMRRILRDGRVIDGQSTGDPWVKHWKGPETIVFGHDARAGLQQSKFAIGLDTGCCYGGDLTAYVLPTKQFIAVGGSKRSVSQRPKHSVSTTPPSMTPPAAPLGQQPMMQSAMGAFSPPQQQQRSGVSPDPQPVGANLIEQQLRSLMSASKPQSATPSNRGTPASLAGLTIGGAEPSFPNAPASTNSPTNTTNSLPGFAMGGGATSSGLAGLTIGTSNGHAKTKQTSQPQGGLHHMDPAVQVPAPASQRRNSQPGNSQAPAPSSGPVPSKPVPAPKMEAGLSVVASLWRHIAHNAARVSDATVVLALLCDAPLEEHRDDMLEDDGIAAAAWAAIATTLLRAVPRGTQGDEMLELVQDIAMARPDAVDRIADRAALISAISPFNDFSAPHLGLSQTVVRATLIALR
jgi:hypothetical protein